jgi:hypothetical protein
MHHLDEHAAGAARRVIDRVTLLRVKEVDEHLHDRARRVELAGLLLGQVGELLDEVLVGVAENVRCDAAVREGQL